MSTLHLWKLGDRWYSATTTTHLSVRLPANSAVYVIRRYPVVGEGIRKPDATIILVDKHTMVIERQQAARCLRLGLPLNDEENRAVMEQFYRTELGQDLQSCRKKKRGRSRGKKSCRVARAG